MFLAILSYREIGERMLIFSHHKLSKVGEFKRAIANKIYPLVTECVLELEMEKIRICRNGGKREKSEMET